MGQQISQECTCQDSFFSFCTPEDPYKEQRNEVQPMPMPGYPAPSGMPMQGYGAGGPTHETDAFRQDSGGYSGGGGGAEAYMGAPPPPYGQDNSPMGGFPPVPPQASLSGGAPPPQASRGGQGAAVTVDDILSNLEGSEEVMYSEAFGSFPGGLNGFVGLDSAAMRDFVCINSSIAMDDIDMELLKVASPDDGLSRDGFLHLLREFCISDGDAISQFMGLSADGESLAAEECRSGLLLFAQQSQLQTNFADERWERIFNTVMWDAGVTVMMEQWLGYAKLMGRIVRLLRFSNL